MAVISIPILSWWEKRLKGQDEEAAVSEPSPDGVTPHAVEEGDIKAEIEKEPAKPSYSQTERLFMGFVVANGGFFAMAHGANDVANSVGPFGATIAAFDGPMPETLEIPFHYYIVSGCCIALGLLTYGLNVMNTIGKKITVMVPSKAFAADFSCTMCTLVATRLGIPVSTTHLEVGAVVGMGVAYGILNKNKEGEEQVSLMKSVNW